MSETKAKLEKEVKRQSAVIREAATLIHLVDDHADDPIEPTDLQRLIAPLRAAVQGNQEAASRATDAPAQGEAILVPRATLEMINAAMNHMGDTINNMDAVEEEDEAHFPAFEAIQALLAAPSEQKPVAVVDEGDDGMFATILPDSSAKVGQQLYSGPVSASPVASDLRTALQEAVDALAGGLWDYGPGQDERAKCDEVVARCRAVLDGAPVASEQKKSPGTRDDFNLMFNCRAMLGKTPGYRTQVNWAIAMDLFAVGSKSAHRICVDAGIDPDATTVARAALAKKEGQ